MTNRDTTAVELPPVSALDFKKTNLKPARLERIRVFLARKLLLRHAYITGLSFWLVPETHPWKALAKSARTDFREVTHVTLRPRGEGGIEIASRDLEEIDSSSERIRKWLWRGVFVWLLLDFVSRHVPGPLSPLGVDDTIRLFERIASSFPSLTG